MFRFNKSNIRDPTVCALLMLLYWHQLKYFFTILTGANIVTLAKHTL